MNIELVKKVCVIGWARSGISICRLLLSLKKEAIVSEAKPQCDFAASLTNTYTQRGVKFEFGGHSESFIKDADLLVLSPGVDIHRSKAVQIAKEHNILCVGEVEFSFWLTKAKFVAITGTNGKSTTTFLTYRILREKRKRVFLGGNIGIPLSSFILKTGKHDLIVLEVSSFQLQSILEFRPYVASLLNLEPNHLDCHLSLKDYLQAKMNIFKNQKQDDFAVLNKNLDIINEIKKNIKAKIVHFSSEFPSDNFSCAYRIASIFGLSKADCLSVFSRFRGLPHRLQFVRRINGINFINDSKSTNPSSTVWALKNVKGNIILIAGGKDKGVDYSTVLPYLKKVKKVHLIGQAAEKIQNALSGSIPAEVFPSLEGAVISSFKAAEEGDTVLISPMCSSFDMFSNYMDRGRQFIEIVRSLR